MAAMRREEEPTRGAEGASLADLAGESGRSSFEPPYHKLLGLAAVMSHPAEGLKLGETPRVQAPRLPNAVRAEERAAILEPLLRLRAGGSGRVPPFFAKPVDGFSSKAENATQSEMEASEQERLLNGAVQTLRERSVGTPRKIDPRLKRVDDGSFDLDFENEITAMERQKALAHGGPTAFFRLPRREPHQPPRVTEPPAEPTKRQQRSTERLQAWLRQDPSLSYLDAEEFQMLALNLEKQLELGAQHAWTLAAARDGTSYEQRVMQHLNEEFEMPTPPFERNPAEALVMDWARKKAVDLLESHGYFTLRHDAVFRPFILAAQNMGMDVVTSEHNPEAVAPLMAQASVFAMDRSVGCKMPLPGKQRLQEVIVTEALQLLATGCSPDLVDAASASLHRFRGTLLPVVPKAQEKTAVVTKPVTPKAGAKKVLFLISDTGGGHRASANAVKDAISELAGAENFDFQIRDIWTDVSGCFPENKIVDMYKLACGSKFGQMLWGAFYYGSPLIEQPWEAKTRLVCGKRFREFFEQEAPDLVVSMHPLTQNLPLRVLDTMARKPGPDGEVKPKIPFATVCTDLGSAHSGWFHNEADVCFVASETLEKKAKRRGLAPEKIKNYGLPVRKQFWSSSKRTTATPPARNYTALGLRPGLKTVLVMGGGEGSGGLDKIVKNIARELDRTQPGECQVVAICGKNEKVVEKLKAQKYPDGVSVAVRGFTSAMSEYMDIADVLVTKAGPGTIAEAAIRGLPTMLSSHLYGQEWGNVPFVVDAGWGEYSTNPRKLAGKVSAVLEDDDLRAEMRAKAQASATPDATKQIAADLLSLLDSAEAEKAASPSPIEALGNFAKRLVPGQGD